jgi:hypothetical protein
MRPRFLAINAQPTRNIASGSRTASELSAKTELARLITAENDHVDLIGGGMELDAQASARHLEKRGVDSAFYPHQPPYDMVSNTYSYPASQLLFYETTKHDRVRDLPYQPPRASSLAVSSRIRSQARCT